MSAPTYEDANIMLQLVRWGAESNLNKAYRFVWGDKYIEEYDEFIKKYPRGTKEFAYVLQVCGWHETLAALWVNGLLNEKLISDWILVTGIWERVKGFALGQRENVGEASLFEHFEALADKQSK